MMDKVGIAGNTKLEDNDHLLGEALDCGFRYGIGYLPGYFDCPNAPWFKR